MPTREQGGPITGHAACSSRRDYPCEPHGIDDGECASRQRSSKIEREPFRKAARVPGYHLRIGFRFMYSALSVMLRNGS